MVTAEIAVPPVAAKQKRKAGTWPPQSRGYKVFRVVNAVIVPESGGRWIEYAGGYADMLAQRGADIAARQVAKPKPVQDKTSLAPIEAKAPKRKLSFNEKHALETLPDRIAALEGKVGELRRRLDDPDLYTRDRQAFSEATAALAVSESELSAAEERWLELEMLRTEIEKS